MDTTPQYKKQCKEAFKDIGFIFDDGPDNLLIVDDDELLRSCLNSKEKIEHYHGQLFTIHGQLYRQDELQQSLINTESIIEDWVLLSKDIYEFSLWATWPINSMEQLWLAFVMHERFQKTWDSDKEKWVKEG